MYLYKSLFLEIVLYLKVVCLFEVCIDGIVGGLQDENREGQIQDSDGQHVGDVIPEEENSELLSSPQIFNYSAPGWTNSQYLSVFVLMLLVMCCSFQVCCVWL